MFLNSYRVSIDVSIFVGKLSEIFPVIFIQSVKYQNNSTASNSGSSGSRTSTEAIMSGTAILAITIISGMGGMYYYFCCNYYGLKVCVAISNLIYRKVS